MSDRTVRVVLEASTGGYEAAMRRAAQATSDLANKTKEAQQAAKGSASAVGAAASAAASHESANRRAAQAAGELANKSKEGGQATKESAAALTAAGAAAGSYEGGARRAAAAATSLTQQVLANKQAVLDVSNALALMGGAALAVAALAVRQFSSFSSAMSGVQAATQASASDMSALREAALQAGADTKYSATEAAQGIEALGRAGVSTRNVLGGGLKGALDLAAAGQMQVKDAAELASIAMTQFNLSGKDVPHVADLLAAGAGKAMGEVSDLGMALKQGGLVASQFGLSIEETVGTLSAFASAGLLGSDAGTSFKSMLQHLADPSKESARLMQQLGINAYDAQGKFVGLAGLAGQLREKLGHLTDAQRQQALAQIFGSDAIRAASILYSQGAEGIQQWTTAVNDSGYAARQAAQLQDNLAGDLEKLGGSWETLAIRMGESANGPLRAAVQALGGFLSALAQSPAAAAALMGVVTVFGAVALGAAALMRGAVHLAEFRSAMDQLGMAGGKLSKVPAVLGKVAKAAGLLGVAFAGVQLAAVLASWNEAAVKTGDELNRTLTNIGNGFTKIDSIFRSVDGKALTTDLFGAVEGIKDLGSALDAIDWDAKWGAGADHSWFGIIQSDAGKAVDALKQVSQQLTQMDAMQAGKSFGKIFEDFKAHGKDAAYTAQFFGDYLSKVKDQLIAAGPAYSDYANNMDKLAEVAGGKLPAGLVYTAEGIKTVEQAMAAGLAYTDHLGNSYDAAGQAAEQLGSQQRAAAAGAEAQAKAIQGVVDALNNYYSAVASAEDSAIKLEAAYDAAAEALEKNGRTLDITTEKGRANRSALLEIAEAAKKLASDMIAAGEGGEATTAKMAGAREQFIKTAQGMGMSADEAAKYADKLGLIPEDIVTRIQLQMAEGDPGKLAQIYNQIQKLPTEKQIQLRAQYPELMKAAEQAWLLDRNLNGIPDSKEVRVTSPGLPNTGASAKELNNSLLNMPPETQAAVSTPGLPEALIAILGLGAALLGLPANKDIPVGVPGADGAVQQIGGVQQALSGLPGSVAVPISTPGWDNSVANANAVTSALGRIPRQTSPSIGTVGHGQAVANANAVTSALGRIPRHVGVSISASSNVPSVAAAAASALAAINGRTATTYIRTVHTTEGGPSGMATGGYVADYARGLRLAGGGSPTRTAWPAGGIVTGPGTPTSDSVPAMLSRREFVVRAAAVEHYGPPLLHALNAKRVPRDLLPGFAGGGSLHSEPPRYLPSPAPLIAGSGRSGGSGTVTINVTMPETAATTGSAGVAWLEEFADRARRASWDRRY
jgi:TP901 family phage tail tape measure protein